MVLLFIIIGIVSNTSTPPATPAAALPATSAPAAASAPEATSAPATPAPQQPAPAPAAPAGPATTAGDGTYQVGVDITAGRYKTPGPDKTSVVPNCYYQRAKNDSGSFDAIIANNNSAGPNSVTVNKGEFVTFAGGCNWTKQ